MFKIDDIIDEFRVPVGKKIKLKDYSTSWDGDDSLSEEVRKQLAAEHLAKSTAELSAAQELLYAADTWSVLCIFQAMDAAGKDGTIKHVMSGVNPQGVQVVSFKRPSTEELDHDFLWRCSKALPERGRIGIFNRSYYEELLVVKAHSGCEARQEEVLGAALREHQRFRAASGSQRHARREVFSACLEGRAEAATARPD